MGPWTVWADLFNANETCLVPNCICDIFTGLYRCPDRLCNDSAVWWGDYYSSWAAVAGGGKEDALRI